MDNEDDKMPFIPLSGLYTNPVNQPPPSISPPPYDSSSAPYPVDAFKSETFLEQPDSESRNKNTENKGF